MTIRVGDVEITRVEELVLPTATWWLFPDGPEVSVEPYREWLAPHFMNERGHLLQSMHTLVVRTPNHTILIDTGVGNGKNRAEGRIPAFHELDTPYLDRLAEAGVDPNAVDLVLCSHLHVDHVGWNTRLEGDRWVPTFPNATYVIVEAEWEHWQRVAETDAEVRQLLDDSVRPVFDAGLVRLVEPDYRLTDEVRLEPSNGHTPGHTNVRIESQGQEAVFVGDAIHNPLQCAFPEIRPVFDRDELVDAAREARLAVLDRYADTGTLFMAAHFHAPSAGYVHRDGGAYRFEAVGE